MSNQREETLCVHPVTVTSETPNGICGKPHAYQWHTDSPVGNVLSAWDHPFMPRKTEATYSDMEIREIIDKVFEIDASLWRKLNRVFDDTVRLRALAILRGEEIERLKRVIQDLNPPPKNSEDPRW